MPESKHRIKKAMRHRDRPGAGARARRKHLKNPQEKVHTVMKEFKRGTLRSGSGHKVTDRDQAIAIAMSEAGLSREQKRSTRGSKPCTAADFARGYTEEGKI